MRRIVKILLWFLVIASFGTAGALAAYDLKKARKIQSRIDERVAKRSDVRKELNEQRLLYRGYQQSVTTLGDSTKMAQAGIIMDTLKDYTKRIMVLENDESRTTWIIDDERRKVAKIRSHMNKWARFPAGAGVVFLIGLLLVRRL